MRILILDANYPAFLSELYADNPGLEDRTYDDQRRTIRAGLFGEVGFQVDALRALGHEADSIITNAVHAQRAWARENHWTGRPRTAWRMGKRRKLPWPVRTRADVDWRLVIEQVKMYQPDVLYVGILDTIPVDVITALKRFARLVVAQVATSIPPGDYRGYDLILSSIPTIVDRFRSDGIDAEYMPLAFGHSVLDDVTPLERDIPISFVGSFTDAYNDRLQIIDAIAKVTPLATWTSDVRAIPVASFVHSSIRGVAFGRQMYAILARSLITVNTHGRVSGQDANNLRLFEATGMGAMLLTDSRRNLASLFDVGAEVVAFSSTDEASRLASWYADHPAEAARIAAAGQARTLREHTWAHRMERVVDMASARL